MTPANGEGVPPGDGGRGQVHNHSEALCDSYAHPMRGGINSLTMRQRMLAESGRIRAVQCLAQRT